MSKYINWINKKGRSICPLVVFKIPRLNGCAGSSPAAGTTEYKQKALLIERGFFVYISRIRAFGLIAEASSQMGVNPAGPSAILQPYSQITISVFVQRPSWPKEQEKM